MICRHCGKEYSDDFAYCPYCAEPKPAERTEEDELTEYKSGVLNSIVLWAIKCLLVCGLLFALALFVEGWTLAIIVTLVVLGVFTLLGVLQYQQKLKPGRTRTINMQFAKDQTSICPKCGSHSIKVYRKGYDYGHAFWFHKYGGRYTAGIDANTACCRCMNCGNDWETNYDYRLIK